MDESGFTIADEVAGGLGSDFISLLDNLKNEKNLGLLGSQLLALQATEVGHESFSSQEQTKAGRKLNFEAVIRNARKWVPQLKRNVESEQLQFGEIATDLRPTTSSLSEGFRPRSTFEAKLQQAIVSSGVTETRVAEAKALPITANIKQQRTNSHIARLKAILFREQQRNRRMNKIKSKMWRKINRKSELIERERLMARLESESPELANKIREEMEIKRAGMRLLRRQNARKKWARVAMRYGGKEMQKVIGREAQNERDEFETVTRIAKTAPEYVSDPDEEEEEEDMECHTDSETQYNSTKEGAISKILKSAKSMIENGINSDDDQEDTVKKPKGLMGLKFMQQAIERERQKNRDQANLILEEIEELEDSVKIGVLSSDDEIAKEDNVLQCSRKKRKVISKEEKKRQLPRISKEELQKAEEELEKQDARCQTVASEIATERSKFINPDIEEKTHASRQGKLETATENQVKDDMIKLREQRLKVEESKVAEDLNTVHPTGNPNSYTRSFKKGTRSEDENKKAKEPNTSVAISDLVQRLASNGTFEASLEQEALVREAFVTGGHAEEAQAEIDQLFLEDEDAKFNTGNGETRQQGWGSWTGEGIKDVKRNKVVQQLAERKQKPKIYINRKLDRKLAPYFMKSVPFPYLNESQFNAANSHPIGPEWNTTHVHKRFIQPEVVVRAGTVIMPLEYAKRLPKDEADSLLDMWSEKGKRKAPKARL